MAPRVRLMRVPRELKDYPDVNTKSTLERWVGHEFVMAGVNEVGWAELDIESVTGTVGETIWSNLSFLSWFRTRARAMLRNRRCPPIVPCHAIHNRSGEGPSPPLAKGGPVRL